MPLPNRTVMWLVLVFGIGAVSGIAQDRSRLTADSKTGQTRKFRDGPLTVADFRGRPTGNEKAAIPGGQLTAFTVTEVRYETRFQVRGAGDNWVARLVSAEAFAVMHRDQSWILQPDDQELLDHEQGHFDTTQILALQVQERINVLRKQRNLVGVGATPAAAQQDLDARLKRELQPLMESHEQLQRDYDVVTRHGRNREAQLAYRTHQREQLAGPKKTTAKGGSRG